MVTFSSMTSDPGSMPRGGTSGQNLEYLQNVVFNQYLDNHLSESYHTWTIGTLYG